MDYTTLEMVKELLGTLSYADDATLARLITAASRAIDRHCSGNSRSENYFELAEVANEELNGVVDNQGRILVYPHKAAVVSVTTFEYRISRLQSWATIVAEEYVTVDGGAVMAWVSMPYRGNMPVRISYEGGLAEETDDLPADLQTAAAFLAVRMYNEAKSGLNDVVGVSDLGQVFYSKAMPLRVVELLKPWVRSVPW